MYKVIKLILNVIKCLSIKIYNNIGYFIKLKQYILIIEGLLRRFGG